MRRGRRDGGRQRWRGRCGRRAGRSIAGSGRHEDAPHRGRQGGGQRAENKPRRGRRHPPHDHRPGEQAAGDDAGAGPGEHRAAELGPATRRELGQAPARRVDEDERAGDAGRKAQRRPERGDRQRHRQRQQRGADEAGANQQRRIDRGQSRPALPDPRLQGAAERADQVADVVRARQPAGLMQIDDAVVQHHRQDRREREPADAHRHGERDQAGDGDPDRAQSASSTISTQFGLVPTGWSPSLVNAPLVPSMA